MVFIPYVNIGFNAVCLDILILSFRFTLNKCDDADFYEKLFKVPIHLTPD